MIKLYVVSLISGLVVSLVMTALSIPLARVCQAMDTGGERKIHSSVTPRWGGIGIVSGFFAGVLTLWLFFPLHALLKFGVGIKHAGKVLFTLNVGEQLTGILLGTLLLFGLGLVDDRKPVRPSVKLSIQVIAAYLAMTYGVRIYGLSIPGFEKFSYFPLWMMQVVTILWLVGITNAVNLIDGLDGLAGGVVAIFAGAFVAVTLVQTDAHSALYVHQMKLAGILASALLGGVLGFLVYNFYPARVFMGDSGSLSVGFVVACLAVIGAFKTTVITVLLAPLLLVAVPATDLVWALGRRLWKRQNPFAPDRGHFHHRLLDAGWTQREVVLLIYVVTLVLGLVSVTMVGMK